MQPVMPPSRPRPTKWVVATCVLAFVAVCLSVTLTVVLLASDGDKVGESAATSAEGACQAINQIPERGFELTAGDQDDYPPDLARLSAAESLAMLAEAQDDTYADLYDAIRKPRAISNETFVATSDEFVEALADAREACADEGF